MGIQFGVDTGCKSMSHEQNDAMRSHSHVGSSMTRIGLVSRDSRARARDSSCFCLRASS